MIINTNNSQTVHSNSNSSEDRVSTNIKKKIEELRKQIQKLIKNDEIDPKVKLEKKKELEQQIQELQNQLRARQAELKKEQSENNSGKSRENKEAASPRKENKDTFEMSFTRGITSVSNKMKEVETINAIRNNLTGQAGVLKAEIKTDGGRGASTEDKHIRLSKINKRINQTNNDIFNKSSKINNNDELDIKNKENEQDKKKADKEKELKNLTDKEEKEKQEINEEKSSL